MKKLSPTILLITILICCRFAVFAQKKISVSQKKVVSADSIKKRQTDSLILEISNTMFNAVDDPEFQRYYDMPAMTIFRIVINNAGKVTNMGFSDSADSLFLKAYSKRKVFHNDKLTFERYAKIKGYKNLSILFLVNFQPRADLSKGCLSYDSAYSLFRFNGKDITGRLVLFETSTITKLSKNNM